MNLYFDLELPSAQRQLDDPEAFLLAQRNRLVILDEVQRMPELFAVLRGVIDIRRRDGEAAGQFLLLGSATGKSGVVLSHPVAGASWEGFVVEQLLAAAPQAQVGFYRTAHGAEADLVLALRHGETWVIEIKRSSAPAISKGFHLAAADVRATRKLLVASVGAPYPMRDGIEVMNPLAAARAVGEFA